MPSQTPTHPLPSAAGPPLFDVGVPLPDAVTNPVASMPGGEHLEGHINDGPYWILALESDGETHWTCEAALAHYPQASLPVAGDLWHADEYPLRRQRVVLVPQLVKELLEWQRDETGPGPIDDLSASFETFPTAADLDAWLVEALKSTSEPQPALAQALAGAVDALGVRALIALLDELDASHTTTTQLVTILSGVSGQDGQPGTAPLAGS